MTVKQEVSTSHRSSIPKSVSANVRGMLGNAWRYSFRGMCVRGMLGNAWRYSLCVQKNLIFLTLAVGGM